MVKMVSEEDDSKKFGPWKEVASSTGKVYYYNCETEISQWDKPKEWADHDAALEATERARQQMFLPPPPPPLPPQPPPQPPLQAPIQPPLQTPMQPPLQTPMQPPLQAPMQPPSFHFPFATLTQLQTNYPSGPNPFPFGMPGVPVFPPPPPPPPKLPQGSYRTPQRPMLYRQELPPPTLVNPTLGSNYGSRRFSQAPQGSGPAMMQTAFQPGPSAASQRADWVSVTKKEYLSHVQQEQSKGLSRDEQRPHPYAIPQPLKPDAPHPYRRQDFGAEHEISKKREADGPLGINDPKRPPRYDGEPMNIGNSEQDSQTNVDPLLKYIDKESEGKAETLRLNLNLNRDADAADHRMDFYSINNKLTHSADMVRKKRLEREFLEHEMEITDARIAIAEKQRIFWEKNPINPRVFNSNEAQKAFVLARREDLLAKCARIEEARQLDKVQEAQVLRQIDEEIAERNRKFEEEKKKRHEAKDRRLGMPQNDRLKIHLEEAKKAEALCKGVEALLRKMSTDDRKPDDTRRKTAD